MQETATRSDEQAQPTPSLFQWVWRSYFRTALIPLVLVEVLFIAIYLAANHLATQENLAAVRTIAAMLKTFCTPSTARSTAAGSRISPS